MAAHTDAGGPLSACVLGVIGSEPYAPLRRDLGLFGYVLVGSAAYLPAELCDGDWDVVLLSSSGLEPAVALPRLLDAVRATTIHDEDGRSCVTAWYVQATACLVKVVYDGASAPMSVDLLFCGGCGAPSTDAFRRYTTAEILELLPVGSSRGTDCILLTHVVATALASPGRTSSFTVDSITALRRWAKTRHVYGTRFGFPGGSAWLVMLLVYSRWYDQTRATPDDPTSRGARSRWVRARTTCCGTSCSRWRCGRGHCRSQARICGPSGCDSNRRPRWRSRVVACWRAAWGDARRRPSWCRFPAAASGT